MTTAIICTAILATLVFALGFNVSRLRGVTAKSGGSQLPSDPADRLFIAIRAHGNATEHVPTLIVLFLLVSAREPTWWSAALIIGATAARLVHAFGMLTASSLAAESTPRLAGALGTYTFGTALAVTAATSI
ncbi:MAPEG family protein [Jiangella gansuensis]|uniref:MAPEG family protein n=1 Tax=Jiangella gansuensis TaxID=281473 RepID=UPI00047C02E3|nr:MAPEG family protein [Jiangella gansuensis]